MKRPIKTARYYPPLGTEIYDACYMAHEQAMRCRCNVRFRFNGVYILATESTSVDSLVRYYQIICGAKSISQGIQNIKNAKLAVEALEYFTWPEYYVPSGYHVKKCASAIRWIKSLYL